MDTRDSTPLAARPMKLYRFLIQPYPHDDRIDPETGIHWHGCLAVAAARSQEEAFAVLQQTAMEEGDPWAWLKLADVTELDFSTPRRLVWAEL